MVTLKFKRVYLLSQPERTALALSFSDGATVVQAANGFGKSALLKSLYDTFGAEPHAIDDSWRKAGVVSAVDFEIDGVDFSIVKFGSIYGIFDANGEKIHVAKSITKELSPWISKALNFKLRMVDQRQDTVIPPPSYAFAPYYIDQDRSWSSAWEPFRGMYLPRSAQALTEYHSGLKPNAYYEAQAERDQLTRESREASARRDGVTVAKEHILAIEPVAIVNFDLADFVAETDRLVQQSNDLQRRQAEYRGRAAELSSEYAQWSAHNEVVRRALGEFREIFESAAGHPVDVECPTCGQHYSNSIASRFEIAADAEALMAALQHGQQESDKVSSKLVIAKRDLEKVEEAAVRVRETLASRHSDISLEQIITAQGRNLAAHDLDTKIKEIDGEIGGLAASIGALEGTMRSAVDRKRSKEIKDHFSRYMTEFAAKLDVRIGDKVALTSAARARGSEGPRGLAAYYYSFLKTTRTYGTSAFCPIVIDAPNQQGQDAAHLPALVSFLVKERPRGSQLILAVEDTVGLDGLDIQLVRVGEKKNNLLAASQYELVADTLDPLLAKMLQ